jgi:hypothetical protein
VRLEERRVLKWGLGLGALAALVPVVYLTGILFYGLSVAPRPVAESAAAPPLIKDAIWARAGGSRATDLRSINPLSVTQFVACMVMATGDEDFRGDNHGKCNHVMPAMYGLEYYSFVHLRDHGVERHSVRGGAGSMAAMFQMTHSWNRDDFLNTLAARADFGYGWRGVEAAARGFFGRPAATLTLPQAAFIASRIGDTRTDPWCEPEAALEMRDRVLALVRDGGAISHEDFAKTTSMPLEFAPPPEGRPSCGK